eukprot:gene3500-3958_t
MAGPAFAVPGASPSSGGIVPTAVAPSAAVSAEALDLIPWDTRRSKFPGCPTAFGYPN